MNETRDLNISPRNQEQRDQKGIQKFSLHQIKQHFDETVKSIEEQFKIADGFVNNKLDGKEYIWRSQIVFLVAALDFYMHELTKYGLCEIFGGNWEKTNKYKNIKIEMETVHKILEAGDKISCFREYVDKRYQKITMMSFDSINEQFKLLGIDATVISNSAFSKTEPIGDKNELKTRLDSLYRRRNLIAHQNDRSHADATIQDIFEDEVRQFIDDTIKIIDSIDSAVHKK